MEEAVQREVRQECSVDMAALGLLGSLESTPPDENYSRRVVHFV
jgi:hypothetical protein